MNENVRKVFDILGIEPYDKFKSSKEHATRIYRLTKDLQLQVKVGCQWEIEPCYSIRSLLLQEYIDIVKLPKFTELEQKAIELYREIGYKWIAKDSSGCVYAYAYDYKPIKKVSLGYWDAVANSSAITQLPVCLNFDSLSFEDTEPYYIGD